MLTAICVFVAILAIGIGILVHELIEENKKFPPSDRNPDYYYDR